MTSRCIAHAPYGEIAAAPENYSLGLPLGRRFACSGGPQDHRFGRMPFNYLHFLEHGLASKMGFDTVVSGSQSGK